MPVLVLLRNKGLWSSNISGMKKTIRLPGLRETEYICTRSPINAPNEVCTQQQQQQMNWRERGRSDGQNESKHVVNLMRR